MSKVIPKLLLIENDSACAQFTLNSAGTQGAENSADVSNNQITQTCWGST